MTTLAERVAARAPKKKPSPKQKGPVPVPPRELVNVGKTEGRGLEALRYGIVEALRSVGSEIRELEVRARDVKELSEEELDKRYPYMAHPGDLFPRDTYDIVHSLNSGVDSLATSLMLVEDVTKEHDLTEAVQDFQKDLDRFDADPKEVEGVLPKAKAFLEKALASVPADMRGPGSLAKLQQCLEGIADACNVMCKGKALKVPKIPRSLDPEDPRQLGLFMARQVVARYLEAKEFGTPEALRQYLRDHPGADPKKHRVAPKTEGGTGTNRAESKPDKGVAKAISDLAGPAAEHPFMRKLKKHMEGDKPVPKAVVDRALEAVQSHLEDDETPKADKAKLRQLQKRLREHSAQA